MTSSNPNPAGFTCFLYRMLDEQLESTLPFTHTVVADPEAKVRRLPPIAVQG
jgi:hypothetical protein